MNAFHAKQFGIGVLLAAVLVIGGCQNLSKLQLSKIGSRAAWQQPEEVVRVLSLFLGEGHWSRLQEIVAEMQQAGYTHSVSHDFLAIQIFEVFAPTGPVAAVGDAR